VSVLVTILFGFVFGFVGSMPVAGPIAVLLVIRSLNERFRSATLIGIGSVFPESAYAMLAFWGFATLLAEHAWMVPVSHAVAAAILLGLGLSLVRRRWEPPVDAGEKRPGAGSFTLGFLVSALNPTVLVAWTGATTTLFSTELVAFRPALALPFGLLLLFFLAVVGVVKLLTGAAVAAA